MDIVTLVLLVVGGVLLVVGAEALVRGASRLAVSVGISPLVVGLTVVAFGTSSPELAVSVSSSLEGNSDIAMGNVVGSNIFNVLFILGIAALVTPLVVAQRLVRLEVPLMIGISVLLLLFALGGTVNRLEGGLLFAGVVAYTAWAIRESRRETRAIKAEYEAEFSATEKSRRGLLIDIVLVIAGLGLLVLGSELFVDGAVEIAESLGVSQLVIALTIVAAGTSMPEVATSVMASIRGERDIAVGNVVGSNIFNILAVLGLSALVADGGVAAADAAQQVDIPVMTAVAVFMLPIMITGGIIARWEGGLFLGYYAAYTAYLILDSADSGALDAYRVVMLAVVVPITVVVLAATTLRAYRRRPSAAQAAT